MTVRRMIAAVVMFAIAFGGAAGATSAQGPGQSNHCTAGEQVRFNAPGVAAGFTVTGITSTEWAWAYDGDGTIVEVWVFGGPGDAVLVTGQNPVLGKAREVGGGDGLHDISHVDFCLTYPPPPVDDPPVDDPPVDDPPVDDPPVDDPPVDDPPVDDPPVDDPPVDDPPVDDPPVTVPPVVVPVPAEPEVVRDAVCIDGDLHVVTYEDGEPTGTAVIARWPECAPVVTSSVPPAPVPAAAGMGGVIPHGEGAARILAALVAAGAVLGARMMTGRRRWRTW
jgi:hypothetical protein